MCGSHDRDNLRTLFSEYGEGSDDNKYLELYNGTGSDVDLSNYTLWKITNDGNWFEREFPLIGILPNNTTYTIVNQGAGDTLAAVRDTTGPVSPEFALFNGNEAFALVKITGPDSTDREILDVIGVESDTVVPANWDVAGVVGRGLNTPGYVNLPYAGRTRTGQAAQGLTPMIVNGSFTTRITGLMRVNTPLHFPRLLSLKKVRHR